MKGTVTKRLIQLKNKINKRVYFFCCVCTLKHFIHSELKQRYVTVFVTVPLWTPYDSDTRAKLRYRRKRPTRIKRRLMFADSFPSARKSTCVLKATVREFSGRTLTACSLQVCVCVEETPSGSLAVPLPLGALLHVPVRAPQCRYTHLHIVEQSWWSTTAMNIIMRTLCNCG